MAPLLGSTQVSVTRGWLTAHLMEAIRECSFRSGSRIPVPAKALGPSTLDADLSTNNYTAIQLPGMRVPAGPLTDLVWRMQKSIESPGKPLREGGAIAPVPWIPDEFARFSTRECLEFLTRSSAAVATGECQMPLTKDT